MHVYTYTYLSLIFIFISRPLKSMYIYLMSIKSTYILISHCLRFTWKMYKRNRTQNIFSSYDNVAVETNLNYYMPQTTKISDTLCHCDFRSYKQWNSCFTNKYLRVKPSMRSAYPTTGKKSKRVFYSMI